MKFLSVMYMLRPPYPVTITCFSLSGALVCTGFRFSFIRCVCVCVCACERMGRGEWGMVLKKILFLVVICILFGVGGMHYISLPLTILTRILLNMTTNPFPSLKHRQSSLTLFDLSAKLPFRILNAN